MRHWLSTCQPGEPSQLLQASSPKMRPNVMLLMRDVMSRYPATLIGCPLLMYGTPDANSNSPASTLGMALPSPAPRHAKPCFDLHFIGWLPCDIQLPVRLPFKPTDYETDMDWRVPTAYVALFRVHPRNLDVDEIVVPSGWWAEVFMHGIRNDQVGNVRIEGDMLLNYPDALEVAAAMQAGARGELLPAIGPFQNELDWAYELGMVFLENCRTQFIGSEFGMANLTNK